MKTAQDQLETMVDTFGLHRVLNMLESICREKAAHIAEAWQEPGLASLWTEAANDVSEANATINTRPVL